MRVCGKTHDICCSESSDASVWELTAEVSMATGTLQRPVTRADRLCCRKTGLLAIELWRFLRPHSISIAGSHTTTHNTPKLRRLPRKTDHTYQRPSALLHSQPDFRLHTCHHITRFMASATKSALQMFLFTRSVLRQAPSKVRSWTLKSGGQQKK